MLIRWLNLSKVNQWHPVPIVLKQPSPPPLSHRFTSRQGCGNWRNHTNAQWTRQKSSPPGQLLLKYWTKHGIHDGGIQLPFYIIHILRIKACGIFRLKLQRCIFNLKLQVSTLSVGSKHSVWCWPPKKAIWGIAGQQWSGEWGWSDISAASSQQSLRKAFTALGQGLSKSRSPEPPKCRLDRALSLHVHHSQSSYSKVQSEEDFISSRHLHAMHSKAPESIIL